MDVIDFSKELLGTRRKQKKEKERFNWRTAVGNVQTFQFYEEKRLDELDLKKFH